MNMLAFLTIAVSILHCQGSKALLRVNFLHIFAGAARHADQEGVWGSWSSWTRDRECHDDHCDGASIETVDTPCADSPSDGKNIDMFVPHENGKTSLSVQCREARIR